MNSARFTLSPTRGFLATGDINNMVVRIVEAPHFEAESKTLGATSENIKAARSLVQAAVDGRTDIVDFERIGNTTDDAQYRP